MGLHDRLKSQTPGYGAGPAVAERGNALSAQPVAEDAKRAHGDPYA